MCLCTLIYTEIIQAVTSRDRAVVFEGLPECTIGGDRPCKPPLIPFDEPTDLYCSQKYGLVQLATLKSPGMRGTDLWPLVRHWFFAQLGEAFAVTLPYQNDRRWETFQYGPAFDVMWRKLFATYGYEWNEDIAKRLKGSLIDSRIIGDSEQPFGTEDLQQIHWFAIAAIKENHPDTRDWFFGELEGEEIMQLKALKDDYKLDDQITKTFESKIIALNNWGQSSKYPVCGGSTIGIVFFKTFLFVVCCQCAYT